MKKLNTYINESVMANYFNPDWDVKPYLNLVLNEWLKNMNTYTPQMLGERYNKVMLCRRCAEIVYILDKFSDDITIHFVAAENKTDNKKQSWDPYGLPDKLYNVFNIIEAAIKTGDDPEIKGEESVKDTIESLRKDFNSLVKKYNDNYNKKLEQAKENGDPVPCECTYGCCDGGLKCSDSCCGY